MLITVVGFSLEMKISQNVQFHTFNQIEDTWTIGITLNSFAPGLSIVAMQVSIPWLWMTAPAPLIRYAFKTPKQTKVFRSKQAEATAKVKTKRGFTNLHEQRSTVRTLWRLVWPWLCYWRRKHFSICSHHIHVLCYHPLLLHTWKRSTTFIVTGMNYNSYLSSNLKLGAGRILGIKSCFLSHTAYRPTN